MTIVQAKDILEQIKNKTTFTAKEISDISIALKLVANSLGR